MSDPRNDLQSKFKEDARYANFGDMLMRMRIKGFRCHSDTVVEFASPITAFCGLNGTGKSTLLQLAAAAYSSPDRRKKLSYYIKDFLIASALDPRPFATDARVEYNYLQRNKKKPYMQLTLSKNEVPNRKGWRGYERRPKRSVFFAGISLYLPKIEKRDFIYRNANSLTISGTDIYSFRIKKWTCRVLGQRYDEIYSNIVEYSKYKSEVASVQRFGSKYSEQNMGFGEGRALYLIRILEQIPEKSLVLIEEPETSLHPSAQHEFGKYLVDVATERCHQILLTTHSEFILEALPSQSRVYLQRTQTGVKPILGLTALQAKSLMANGHVKALNILVEDECARAILRELIRRFDPNFLQSVGIYPAGNNDTIKKTIRALKDTGLPVAAVVDGDTSDSPSEDIFKLPGTKPPEKELFANDSVKRHISSKYEMELEDFSISLVGVHHHDWFDRLADRISVDESAIIAEAAGVYAQSISEPSAHSLIQLLKEATRR